MMPQVLSGVNDDKKPSSVLVLPSIASLGLIALVLRIDTLPVERVPRRGASGPGVGLRRRLLRGRPPLRRG